MVQEGMIGPWTNGIMFYSLICKLELTWWVSHGGYEDSLIIMMIILTFIDHLLQASNVLDGFHYLKRRHSHGQRRKLRLGDGIELPEVTISTGKCLH